MKSLTKEQIQQLFDFTKSHRIRYYDLQSEVVDHLASAIEAKWNDNPALPFQKALEEVYTDFGIFGFGKLEQEKRQILQTKIRRNVWKYVKSFLTPPKVLLTLILIFLWYQCLGQIGSGIIIINGTSFALGILFSILVYVKLRKEKVLFESFLEIHSFYAWSGFIFYLYYVPLYINADFTIASPTTLLIIATVHVLLLITLVGIYQYLEEMIEVVKRSYPHYNFG